MRLRRTSTVVVALVVLLVLVASSAAATSGGSTPAATSTTVTIPLSNGGAVRVTTTVTPLAAGARLGVIPLTSGWHWNGTVGIDVVGTGLYVNYANSQGTAYTGPGCATGHLTDNMGHLDGDDTGEVCWDSTGGAVVNSTWGFIGSGHNFPNGDQVCVNYDGKNAPIGKPCITISS
jgi:hypothetical protein